MKLVIDERLKHRITGVVVIMSILAVFLPAMMKKSNQRFEESLNLSMRLPAKPALPQVSMSKPAEVFKTVKVAHVEIESVMPAKEMPVMAKAEPLTNVEPTIVDVAVKQKATTAMLEEVEPPKSKVETIRIPVQAKQQPSIKAGLYAVQLASFSQERNAQLLVTKLNSQGYKATYNRLNNKNGALYKVLVGQINEKNEAINLQKKLAQAMQLNGFIVKTGVS